MRIEGLATQLKVRATDTHQAVFEKGGGDSVGDTPVDSEKPMGCVGKPTIPDTGKRKGSGGWQDGGDWQSSVRSDENWWERNAERPERWAPGKTKYAHSQNEGGW